MSSQRRNFGATEKVKILRQHLLEKIPISQVCDQHGIAPTQFYQWQKIFFENGPAAFVPKDNGAKNGPVKKLEKRVTRLQERLTNKDEVIAEIMESHVQLKKRLARTERLLGRTGYA